jgi:serine/threonine protein kinase
VHEHLSPSHYVDKAIETLGYDQRHPAVWIKDLEGKPVLRDSYQILAFEAKKFGSVFDFFAKGLKRGGISRYTRLNFCYKFYLACKLLHANEGLSHNDLKLDNILISDDCKNLQLCDFGHSTPLKGWLSNPKVGTGRYRAPEINYLNV